MTSMTASNSISLLSTKEVIRIRTAHPESTAQALRTLSESQQVQANASYIEVQGVSSEQVMSFLVTHGLTPQEVSINHPDLESIFLELTQKVS